MTPLRHPQEVAQMPFIWGNIVATPPGANAHSHHIVATPPGDYKYITIIYIYTLITHRQVSRGLLTDGAKRQPKTVALDPLPSSPGAGSRPFDYVSHGQGRFPGGNRLSADRLAHFCPTRIRGHLRQEKASYVYFQPLSARTD